MPFVTLVKVLSLLRQTADGLGEGRSFPMVEIASTGDQMLQVLELVATNGPITTTRIAEHLSLNRTVAHRLIATLHSRKYVSRGGDGYSLGPAIAKLSAADSRQIMLPVALPVMRTLSTRTRETVVLHRIDGDIAVVVAQTVDETQLVRVQHRQGSSHDLAFGASGRALLAWQPERVVARAIARSGIPDLGEKLKEIRACGIAFSEEELQDGVIGMAVPLVERSQGVSYSLAVLAPTQRRAAFLNHKCDLLTAKLEIEAGLNVGDD